MTPIEKRRAWHDVRDLAVFVAVLSAIALLGAVVIPVVAWLFQATQALLP